jgi:hypothetical protein
MLRRVCMSNHVTSDVSATEDIQTRQTKPILRLLSVLSVITVFAITKEVLRVIRRGVDGEGRHVRAVEDWDNTSAEIQLSGFHRQLHSGAFSTIRR